MDTNAGPAANPLLSRRTLLKVGGAAFAGTALDGFIGSEAIRLERKKLRLPRWDADGFRVALVSDIHVNTPPMRDNAIDAMRMAIATKPDLFVFTGDFVNAADPKTLRNVRDVLRLLDDVSFPCYAVPGNHDYTCHHPRKLFDLVRTTRLRLLRNETVDVNGVSLVGLDDALLGTFRPQLAGDPGLSRSTLVLVHEPDFVDDLPGKPSLVLSGHSHGGEICLPMGIPIHTPVGAKKYKSGLYTRARHPVYVSRGVASLSHCRIFCPPEVTIFTLTS